MNVRQNGFTLIEAIVVMVITGIIAAVVAVFIVKPVQGYFDSARRAEMTDTADTALRRMAREIRAALPNSVRVTNGATYSALEFLPVSNAGRYRIDRGVSSSDDPLDFTTADTSFDILSRGMTFSSGDQIVIYNLGIPGANAYDGDNRRAYNGTLGVSVLNVKVASTQAFPFDSPSHRFFVVNTPVTFLCDLTAKTLRRYSGYSINSIQPTSFSSGVATSLLAQNVSSCAFNYSPGLNERYGLVTLTMGITEASQAGNNETVTLYHEVHVSNVP